MSWVVDTCVVIDVFAADPKFGVASAKLLEELKADGLVVAPVTMVELAPAFDGDMEAQKRFLELARIDFRDPWTLADTEAAHAAWASFIRARKASNTLPKRPVADLLIGGFAANRQGLITRNPGDFRRWFPSVTVREP